MQLKELIKIHYKRNMQLKELIKIHYKEICN